MSHIAAVSLEIHDLEALKKAVERVGGLEFREGQTTYKWYGTYMGDYSGSDAAFQHGIKPEDYGKCLHAISVKDNSGAYEVGVVANPNGKGYMLVWDFWAGGYGLKSIVGENCANLKQAYGVEKAKAEAKKRGFLATEKRLDNGSIQLVLRKAM